VPFTLKDGLENERMNALAGLAKTAFRCAVIKASSNKGLFGVTHALPETTGMKEVGDILLTDGSLALGTLKFK